MNSLKDADFYATFPPALKKDEKMVALAKLHSGRTTPNSKADKKEYHIRKYKRVIGNVA